MKTPRFFGFYVLAMIFCGTVLSLWISVAEAQDITGLADEALIMTGTFQQLCKTNHFSAQVQVETHLPAIEKTNTVQISQSDTNLRMQLKISEIAASSAQMRTALEKLGVDDVTVIVNEEKLQTYIVFPQLKCFIENPASTQTMDLIKSSHEVNFRRTVLSAENVLGHSCSKIMLSKPGKNTVGMEWEDEKSGMPVKVEITRGTELLRFLTLKFDLSPLSPAEFEVPSGFTNYTSFSDVLQEAKRRLQNRAVQ